MWSYAELDALAEAAASALERASGSNSLREPVGVCADRSVAQIVGLLAAAKARRPYIPLDPSHPGPRLASMIAQAEISLVLTSSRQSDHPGLSAVKRIDLTENLASPSTLLGEDESLRRRSRSGAAIHPQELAYLIFTSGTTGQPNGVEVTQANLAHLIDWHQASFRVQHEDRATVIAGIGFDASVWEIWPYLTAGATLVIPPEEVRLDPHALVTWLDEARITLSFLPTPLAQRILSVDAPPPRDLRVLLTGGDRLHALAERTRPFEVRNNYGPTETHRGRHFRTRRLRRHARSADHRPSHRPHARLRPRRTTAPRPARRGRRTLPGRRRGGSRVRRTRRVDRGTIPSGLGRSGTTHVPHRRPGPPTSRRTTRVPRPGRHANEDPRVPDRDRRSRTCPSRPPARAGSRGRGPAHRRRTGARRLRRARPPGH